MERLFRGLEALRRNPRGGMSMIVAVCAGVLLLGLTASLLYSASLPLARANRKIGQERCRQLSASFAQVLDGELRRYITDSEKVALEGEEEKKRALPESGAFYNYANRVMEGIYGEYDPTDPDSVLYYSLSEGNENNGNYGKLTVRLRKTTLEDPAQNLAGQEAFASFPYDDRAAETDAAEQTQFIRYQFTVEAAVELDDDSSSTSTEYYRKDSFLPVYTWHTAAQPSWITVDTDFAVHWHEGYFYRDSGFTQKMEPRELKNIVLDESGNFVSEETWTEDVRISYVYDTAQTTYKRYIPIYEERASQGKSAPAGEGGDAP